MGSSLPIVSVLPFAALILSIAFLPALAPRWWEPLRNRGLAVALCALPTAILLARSHPAALYHAAYEYAAFIALLASLFIISGGIVLSGDLRATPAVNTAFLAVGVVAANLIGTTGASMLLIRPLLQTNSERKHVAHIPVFFIFLVSNIGGCLTPLADPPLFLGFLRGVPFAWTLRLLPEWAFMVGLLLVIFFFLDRRMVRRESVSAIRLDRERRIPLRMQGAHNFVFLAGVLLSLFLPGSLAWLRALLMLGLAGVAFLSTPRALHMQNRFTFFPINEVAILFAGIFVTMVPALLLLEERGAALGISEPWQFFWLGGALSGVLDNAPTYLTFAALAHGTILPGMAGDSLLPLVRHPAGEELLRAISLGTVFMGANTYIGNGPNFMVRAIAESRKVPMPGFFGYMLWSGGILVPLFALVTWIFLL